MQNVQTTAAAVSMAVGAADVLAPQATAKAFGLDELDGQARWLSRLFGSASIGLGVLTLDARTRDSTRTVMRGVLLTNAAVTVAGVASGSLSKRTGALALGYIGALAAALAADD